MSRPRRFFMAGGGTGGHVIPALAVAEELRRHGDQVLFVGTRTGMEAKLVPAAGFPLEWIEIGGLKRVGLRQTLRTLVQLPLSVWHASSLMSRVRPHGVFSMGGFVAGPVMLAAWLRRIPIVVMEPNALPGFTNRWGARLVRRALLSFPEAARFFPTGRTELTGLPVRREFFQLPAKPPSQPLTVLITGGSRGSRTLNRAARESWPFFRENGPPVRILHQTGTAEYSEYATAFAASGMEGEIMPFIQDMPGAFARADLLVCRAGAGAVAELGAAGKPAILVPFPFAADQHQLHNAQAMERAGAALLLRDAEMSGERLWEEVRKLAESPARIAAMGEAARQFGRPGAAQRAAEVLWEVAQG